MRAGQEQASMKHSARVLHHLWILAIGLSSVLWLPACDNGSSTTSPTATATLVTDTFTGSIEQNGSRVHPFTVTSSGYTLLAGYTVLTPSSLAALGLGIGSWDGTSSTCSLNVSQNDTARSGSTGLSGTSGSGSFCVRVYDGGNIPTGVTASYTVQIQHY
jgi:hypothetical protein